MISKHSLSADGLKERRGAAGNLKNDQNYVKIGRHSAGASRTSAASSVRRLMVKNLGAGMIVTVVVSTLIGLFWRLAAASFQAQSHHNGVDTDSAAAAANHHLQENPSQDVDAAGGVLSNNKNNVGGGVRKTRGVVQQNSLQHRQQLDDNHGKQPPSQQHSMAEFWILETDLGHLRIRLRPDLSPESVAYIQQVVHTNTCQACRFYRAEKPGIFQGIVKSETVSVPTVHGNCPYPQNDTKKEVCHGPIMTRGMVGWAGGLLGPDFFIDTYERPAEFWGTVHTGTFRAQLCSLVLHEQDKYGCFCS